MEAARNDPTAAQVTNLADYLRETITELDETIAELTTRRRGLKIRLAAIEATSDPLVVEAAEDYRWRVESNQPYEHAEDAESLLSEATRRFGP